jgi:hypothetical protein
VSRKLGAIQFHSLTATENKWLRICNSFRTVSGATCVSRLSRNDAKTEGAATEGERVAAGAAAERIRDRLGQAAGKEKEIEVKFSISDIWSRQLFVALCRRYGLHPFRYRRMHRQTIIIRAPKSFVDQVLWPEFEELSAALTAYLSEITERVIREEVHGETGEADEVDEPRRIGG